MKWILLIVLFHRIGDGGQAVYIELPMQDQMTCEAAKSEVSVLFEQVNGDSDINWRATICEPK